MKRAVFLDRDGTLIVDKGYLADPEEVELLPGAAEAVGHFVRLGYTPVIVTNQSGIGRGYYPASAVEAVNARTVDLFKMHGAVVPHVYFCPHAPNDDCDCRKPAPGMLLRAARENGLDLGKSIMIGDKTTDVEAGRAAGCTVNVLLGGGTEDKGAYAAPDLLHAVEVLERLTHR